MDSVIVGIIIIGAVFFTIRSFIRTYKGESDCSCKNGCSSCSFMGSCRADFPIVNKK